MYKRQPWLWPRLNKPNVELWPETRVTACSEDSDGALALELDNGQRLAIDHVVLATGYRVNMSQVPFLTTGNVFSTLDLEDGFPVLDNQLQSSIPGLFITSLPATQDFGPFFAFTVAVKVSAKVIGKALL